MQTSVLDFWKTLVVPRDLASFLTSMLPSLDDTAVPNYLWLLDYFQYFWNPWSPQNTPEILRQEYKVDAAHELKPLSEPLLAPVEWFSAPFVMTIIITLEEPPANSKVPDFLLPTVPYIPSAHIQSSEGWDDNCRSGQMSWWAFLSCHIWPWTLHCWLPRTSLAGWHCPRLVPQVSL